MSNVSIPTSLPSDIAKLLSQRQAHVSAIATIDATLARVTTALGGPAAKPAPVAKPAAVKKPVAPKAAPVAKKAPVAKAAAPSKAPVYAVTANDLVLGFIKSKKNPTTQEVAKHWKDQGRKGTPDNTLSQLTKIKKLKRLSVKGQRGSRYSVV